MEAPEGTKQSRRILDCFGLRPRKDEEYKKPYSLNLRKLPRFQKQKQWDFFASGVFCFGAGAVLALFV